MPNQGKFIYDDNGICCHRVWFKNIFNPILRIFGFRIVSQIIITSKGRGIVLNYKLKRYYRE